MVVVTGTARIRHAETGDIYEISGDEIDFAANGAGERAMGDEIVHTAVVDHPDLGQLVWSLWEYPVGAENDRETDVGPHDLLANIDFELDADPPDDEERQARIETLVDWFHEHFEDPAHRLPYISREGGYQWIFGGPYDAREELEGNFPNESEHVIDAAVEEIQSDGLFDWAPVPRPEDYDDYDREDVEQDDDDVQHDGPSDDEVDVALRELEGLFEDIPTTSSAPTFEFGDDGLLHMASAADAKEVAADDVLLDELKTATSDLKQSLAGTNAHRDLLDATEFYEAGLSEDPLSISRLYARGVRLENAAHTTQRAIEEAEFPPLNRDVQLHLDSVLTLHGSYIMSREGGRALVDNAAAYRKSPDQVATFKEVAGQLAIAIQQSPDLFGEDVREHIADSARDIGKGPRPERSNQIAGLSLGNLLTGLLKGLRNGEWFVAGAVFEPAIAGSLPGQIIGQAGTDVMNTVWLFLTAHYPALVQFVASLGPDFSWMRRIFDLFNVLRRSRGR